MQVARYGPPISLADAKRVIEAAETEAAANDWTMVIAVFDSTGHLVALHKMDHAQYGSVTIAQAKAGTAVDFKRPSKVFEDGVTAGGIGLRMLSRPEVCPMEGGVPLLRNGELVGAVGVSGAKPNEDAQVAMAGVAVLDG